MKKIVRIILALAAFSVAVASLSSCIPGSGGGAYLPVPDERVELFTNQNNSGKDDDYERKWRHGGSFRPVHANAENPGVDIYVNSDGLKIDLPAAEAVSYSVYDESGTLVSSETFPETGNGCTAICYISSPGEYRVVVVVDGIVYSGILLK